MDNDCCPMLSDFSIGNYMHGQLTVPGTWSAENGDIYNKYKEQENGFTETDQYSSIEYYKLAQGHMLNADLGGRALKQNLFPISDKLNMDHAGIENEVKRRLFTPSFSFTRLYLIIYCKMKTVLRITKKHTIIVSNSCTYGIYR